MSKDADIIYRLNSQDEFVHLNEAWVNFAVANDASSLLPDRVSAVFLSLRDFSATCANFPQGLKVWRSKPRMENEAIAGRLARLANLMEIRGDDQFRVRSYRNAAEVIETWPTPLRQIAAEEGVKGLQALPGVGKAISGKIVELLEKGTFDAWEKLTAETPETTLDLLKVGGIGLKTAAALHQQFKISSLDDLKKFVAGGGLEMVDGVGERSAERITESLKRL